MLFDLRPKAKQQGRGGRGAFAASREEADRHQLRPRPGAIGRAGDAQPLHSRSNSSPNMGAVWPLAVTGVLAGRLRDGLDL